MDLQLLHPVVKVPTRTVLAEAGRRPPGYLEHVLALAGVRPGDAPPDMLDLPDGYAMPEHLWAEPPKPVPRSAWPLWAVAFSMLAHEGEKGVGSTIHRLIGNENSERFKAWHLRRFKKACGCQGRQNQWDFLYPYANPLHTAPTSAPSPSTGAK